MAHADRRRARRARPRAAAVLHRRRGAGRRGRAPCAQRRTIRCGGCRCGRATTPMLDSKIADLNNVGERRHGRLDHLRAVPQALRLRGQELAAFRHLRLDAGGAGRAGRKAANARPRARSTRCCARATADAAPSIHAITPARPDLAASHLRGQVDAPRLSTAAFSRWSSVRRRCATSRIHDATLITEALHGRARHDLRDERRRLGVGTARRATAMSADLPAARCSRRDASRPTRSRRCARCVFPGPSIKLPPSDALPLGATVAVAREEASFAVTPSAATFRSGIWRRSTAAETDFVAVAERFLGTPYLWGGKTSSRHSTAPDWCRCALTACGVACPRDSDMQEAALGRPSTSTNCGAATCCSGRATSRLRATPRPSSMPTRITWWSRSSRLPKPLRASARAAARFRSLSAFLHSR